MSFLLRVVLPDRPGMLGAVATALGMKGGDIVSVDVVERAPGTAVDDIVIELPPGKLPDSLVSAAVSIAGVSVESIRPYHGGLDTHRELELVEAVTAEPDRSIELLIQSLPRIFRAGWALELRPGVNGPEVGEATNSAPDMAGVDVPWYPVEKPTVLDSDADWVPTSWQTLGTELAAAPIAKTASIVLIGRTGGPIFRASELMRLAHLAGIVGTVVESTS